MSRVEARTSRSRACKKSAPQSCPPVIRTPPEKASAVKQGADGPALVCGLYRLQDLRVFQCDQCLTVLGDSLRMCGEDASLACIVCLRVTNDVIIDESLLFDADGILAGSTYNALYCGSCRILVGFCLHSTSKRLAHLRRLFCLSKEKICCYLLESKKTVPATDLNFNFSSMKEKFEELKTSLVDAFCSIRYLTSRLETLDAGAKQTSQSAVKLELQLP